MDLMKREVYMTEHQKAEASENIEKLVSILLTFTPDQMAAFVAGAREIIAQYK